MPIPQLTLFDRACPCGAGPAQKAGLCRRCYFRQWHSLARFDGLREHVLARDRKRCRVCGSEMRPIVHHRRREATDLTLITLCPACHARIHRLR